MNANIPNQQNAPSFEGFLKGVKQYKRAAAASSYGKAQVLKSLLDAPLSADQIRGQTGLSLGTSRASPKSSVKRDWWMSPVRLAKKCTL